MYEDCPDYVPFSKYDWTFNRQGPPKWNPAAYCIIAGFCAVAYWMSIELVVLVYATFKRRSGVYFWSIIITTLGIVLQATGYLMKEFAPSSPIILTTIICKVGWVGNVTGFAIVLWSRLHLVVHEPRILKAVLAMVIVNGICFHTPVVVFEFGLITKHHANFVRPMEIMERAQQTVFSLQETIISGLYIFQTWRFLNSGYPSRTRNVVRMLACVQALVIALDAGLTAFDYKNMLTLKCSVHPFVYALKLKLEFIVLNQLLSIVKKGLAPGLMGLLSSNSGSSSSSTEEKSREGPSGLPGRRISEVERAKVAASFITKPALMRQSTASSAGVSSTGPVVDSVMVSPAAASMVLAREEADLIDVVGRPDDLVVRTRTEISDVERQYLGQFRG
ncbi:hypothetical protein BS50DRAFT_615039 [Corynespora cassiicola Philippines]|uniref:DUF7703 domain-containing protein n=1 Tax=Corynespora cassiicola Philippines TaxID=1448308 RepID=A0A2T2P8U7_CORCC|nr:hypothetical protein BS50DRAFT_615039 [Corynespora cassiicola Philippines]